MSVLSRYSSRQNAADGEAAASASVASPALSTAASR